MARGTVVGEQVVSQANTAEFEAGYERIFGKREPTRGRWIWDERQGKLVRAEDYVPPSSDALHAPIVMDRHYENTKLSDGTDVSSRRKYKDYLKRTGYTHASDYREYWKKAAEKREAVRRGEKGALPSRTRREVLERKWHQMFKP